MRKNQPDYSDHEANFSLLAHIFPHIRPYAFLFGSNKKFDRSNAATGIVIQFCKATAALLLFFLMSAALVWLDSYTPEYGIKDSLQKIIAILVGLPVMLVILLSFNQAFDLFDLLVTGYEFDNAGGSLKSVKIFMLVTGFVGGLFLTGYGYYKFQMYDLERGWALEKLAEQKELVSLMAKGREAWNRQVTSGPNERVDLSGVDLSGKTFEGFFFKSANFSECNLTGTVFKDCHLGYATFNAAVCHRTVFENSYLYGAEFKQADCKEIDLTGAFGVAKNFAGARIAEKELQKLLDPAQSRWNAVSWFDFQPEDWLKEKGYWTDGRKPKGLGF